MRKMTRPFAIGLGLAIALVGCRRAETADPAVPPVPEAPLYGPVVTQDHLPPVLQGLSFGIATHEDFAPRFAQENLATTLVETAAYGGETDLRWRGRHPNDGVPYTELAVERRLSDGVVVGDFYADLSLVILRFSRSEAGRGPVLAEAEIAQPASATPSICDPARALVEAPGALDACPNRFPYSPEVSEAGYALCVGSPDGRRRMMVRCVEPSTPEGTRRIFYTMAVPTDL